MQRKFILSIIIIAFLGVEIKAQVATSLTYNMGFPVSDLKDYTNSTSFRGVSVDTRYFIEDNATIGFYLGWQVFKERVDGLFKFDGNDISGLQVRYANTFPIMFTGHYHFGEDGGVRPYLGAGVGTVRSLQRTDIGIFTIVNNNWHFAFYPEVGVFIPFTDDLGANVGIKYNYAIGSSDSIDYTYLGINVGLVWFK